ncbi:hypothetical protein B4119_3401 [Parageobacillus caldoxylosilyticus]|uniref:Uncharacterized protein n=1 Tax=Saccharococcus caldoxylosilyticus TaxID=81408 RepID=A0A150L5U6_9BACL|nr:hypothetical protein B4119_3401 [Parageobacillus caldoxylosilyticus]
MNKEKAKGRTFEGRVLNVLKKHLILCREKSDRKTADF